MPVITSLYENFGPHNFSIHRKFNQIQNWLINVLKFYKDGMITHIDCIKYNKRPNFWREKERGRMWEIEREQQIINKIVIDTTS